MKFRTLFKAVFSFAIIALVMDYLMTVYSFAVLSHHYETNPLIRSLIWTGVDPFVSLSVIFLATLALILIAIDAAMPWLDAEPYSGDLHHVGRYMLTAKERRTARDVAMFGCLALATYIMVDHILGFLSWLPLLQYL
ncbi:MAG: hypothetical protein QMC77_08880 [Methanocellales archaeon]|nr:hypothetical protein [Methanocellales archaeon]